MREHHDRERLRQTFGSVAEQYDRARPAYPAAVFDDLAELAQLEPGSRVLEVGPGTGKATAELERRGYVVTGIELSPELAEIARRNAPAAEIAVGDFETWEPPEANFDAVVAFTAFHWIAPELRYAKPARLLRPGGALAVVHTHHVRNDDPFWFSSQEDYDAVVPHPDNAPPPLPEEVASWVLDEALFRDIVRRRYPVETVYSPDEYIALIETYSDNIALPAAQREELFRRLRTRIEAQGTVRKLVVYELTVGYRPR
ncbi:MAG TPA: class I SAM-dependent methyltransferase [Gaiellaceae bacterium]|nr:class I SAM-dependent methyltransferase [Gaiellaceae bacterium]